MFINSILSRNGVSGNPGAVQWEPSPWFTPRESLTPYLTIRYERNQTLCVGSLLAIQPEGGQNWVVGLVRRVAGDGVADPFGAEVFCTDGTSAWVRQDGVDTPLAPTPATQLVDVNLDPPFPSAPGFRAVDLLAHPDFGGRFRPRVVSTTLALAWVAAGRRAAYVTDGGDLSGSVHFAAGIALCRAAGCVVTGVDGVPVGQGGRGLVAAADAETHGLLMSMIRG